MLRLLPLPADADPLEPVIRRPRLDSAHQCRQVLDTAHAEAAAILHTAQSQADALHQRAQREGYRDGYAQALHAVVPTLSSLLCERSRWLGSVRDAVRTQLTAELARLDFTQAQIERWTALQEGQGAHQIAVYLPRDQSELLAALQVRLDGRARVEAADVQAPVIAADDLAFILEPAANLPVDAASADLAGAIQAAAEHYAAGYLRTATRIDTPTAVSPNEENT